jgi:hypothetical protein
MASLCARTGAVLRQRVKPCSPIEAATSSRSLASPSKRTQLLLRFSTSLGQSEQSRSSSMRARTSRQRVTGLAEPARCLRGSRLRTARVYRGSCSPELGKSESIRRAQTWASGERADPRRSSRRTLHSFLTTAPVTCRSSSPRTGSRTVERSRAFSRAHATTRPISAPGYASVFTTKLSPHLRSR